MSTSAGWSSRGTIRRSTEQNLVARLALIYTELNKAWSSERARAGARHGLRRPLRLPAVLGRRVQEAGHAQRAQRHAHHEHRAREGRARQVLLVGARAVATLRIAPRAGGLHEEQLVAGDEKRGLSAARPSESRSATRSTNSNSSCSLSWSVSRSPCSRSRPASRQSSPYARKSTMRPSGTDGSADTVGRFVRSLECRRDAAAHTFDHVAHLRPRRPAGPDPVVPPAARRCCRTTVHRRTSGRAMPRKYQGSGARPRLSVRGRRASIHGMTDAADPNPNRPRPRLTSPR